MKMTFRWYGEDDPVTLDYIRQIPCMTGVVTAVYSVPVGEVWPEEAGVSAPVGRKAAGGKISGAPCRYHQRDRKRRNNNPHHG